ncbi:MAG: lytic murein transglycosylase [Patescibacteria group bacterium]
MKYVLVLCFYIAMFFTMGALNAQALDCNDPANREQCLAELDKTEKEIVELNAQLKSKKNEATSIARDKAVLELQTKQAQLKIKAHELSIAKLGKDITVKESNIQTLNSRIVKSKASLSEMIVRSNELDDFSLVEVFLAQDRDNISGFFQDIDAYGSIQSRIKDEIGFIDKDKKATEKEKSELDSERDKEYDSKYEIEAQKKVIQKAEAEKQRLLSLNQKEQATYQGTIAQKAAAATKIRNALFALRDTGSIKFEDAVAYAKQAGKAAGVRPAFILAILQQESNLGSNVGSCYMTNTETGAGVKVSSGAAVANVMKPTRDVQPFLRITKALGKDPFQTRVSCPLSIGYGGAMGPAQFIPSTWQIFETRISNANGGGAANPWNARDAFTASGLYLGDLGATAQTASAERNAACKYYSGASCGTRGNTSYGDQVMARAIKLQADIDLIQN